MQLYSLRDSAARCFGNVICSKSEVLAIRDLKILVNKDNNAVAASPSDYELWYIGEFDDLSGEVSTDGKKMVARCVDLIANK